VRLAVTTTGPVTLIFFCSSGEVIGGSLTKNVLLYMSAGCLANRR
jgi:hypothetical protein